jgi:predicted  nucleic acid-binding Zn-ribbon protein
MRHVAALRRLALGATLAALVVAAPAGAKTLHGTVVHRNTSQKSFVLAARSGKLTVVSARSAPAVGRVAAVKVRRRHGASVARRIRLRGITRHARLHGRVSFSGNRRFAISARGTSIFVNDSGSLPRVGSTITTTVTINRDGSLDADDVNDDDRPSATGAMKLEGTISAVDPTARTLTVSADDHGDDQGNDDQGDDDQGDNDQGDDNEAASQSSNSPAPSVTVHVPAGIDITQFRVGDDVELVVTPQGDGSFLLQSVDDDQRDDNGNDQGSGGVQQGDDNGSDDQGDDNGGDDGGSDD